LTQIFLFDISLRFQIFQVTLDCLQLDDFMDFGLMIAIFEEATLSYFMAMDVITMIIRMTLVRGAPAVTTQKLSIVPFQR